MYDRPNLSADALLRHPLSDASTADTDGDYLFTIVPVADYSSVQVIVTGP